MPIPYGSGIAPAVTAIAYAASITPNSDICSIVNVGQLTGNLTVNAPTGTPADGQQLRFRFALDASSRTITWNSAFAFGTDVTSALVPTTASAKFEIMFGWHAGDSKWRALAITRGF